MIPRSLLRGESFRKLTQKRIKVFLDHGRLPIDVNPDKIQAVKASLPFVEGYLPNGDELRGITGENDIKDALTKALSFGPKFIVVKLGKKGCWVFSQNFSIKLPGYTVHVIDTVGAGDSFNAGFVYKYLLGETLERCTQFANATAAFKVSKNRLPTSEEVESFISSHQ